MLKTTGFDNERYLTFIKWAWSFVSLFNLEKQNFIEDLTDFTYSIQDRDQYQLSLTSQNLRKNVTFLFTQEFDLVHIYSSEALLL